jgi:ABC-type transport system involved in multi-copper enzyme maturation permease subunit
MRTHVWWALARGVVLESVRRKDLWVVAILGGLVVLATGLLGAFGMDGLEIFAKDLAVTVLSALSTVLAALVSTRAMPEEIRHRTLYPLLARPISRFDLLCGKLFGAIVVSWIAFLALAVVCSLALAAFHIHFEWIMVQYVIAKMMGLALVCVVGLTLSLVMTPAAAATLNLLIAFASGMIVRAMVMSAHEVPGWTLALYRVALAVIPQYGMYDLGGRVANIGWEPVPLWVFGGLGAYLAIYGACMLALAWLRFRRQGL